ncbi:thiamine pyrophosphate-binding protein [Microbispora sp. NPDC088329]|uniref:thiamine pyrophosphate-binding protein n=1 Tax=Microbispora sp. NPDC088329 TaxID=3154869 RepID=UPI003425CE47
MTGADLVVDVLADEGVRHVFGNPGTTELPLVAALSRRGEPGYVLGLQESVVVGMADGYAQATRRPSFVNVHAMAGLGNALGNLTNAQVQGSPMVVTAGQADQRHLVADPLLSGDLTGLAAPVTKWAHEVRRVDDLEVVLRRAFRDAASPRRGPVFVSLPTDVLQAETPATDRTPKSAVIRDGTAPGVEDLLDILLGTAPDRILMVAGDDVSAGDAVGALVELAEALGAAVLGSSLYGTTVFPTTHPLWAGEIGLTAGDIRETLRGYDRVLVLGGRAFMAYGFDPGPMVPSGVELLQIAEDPHQIARFVPVRLGLVGGLRATLRKLAAEVRKRGDAGRAATSAAGLATTHLANRAEREAAALDRYPDSPMAPQAAVHALLRAIPDDVVVVDESMTCDEHVRALHRADGPGRYFAARGGGLGWAMPAALGISLAYEREPVLCVVGDGSAMYSPQAMWTAAHEGLPVVFAVVNNAQYLMLKRNLRRTTGRDDMSFVGMDVDDPAVDFLALAEAMGVEARRATSPADVAEAAEFAWSLGRPYLIDLPIGPG